MSHKQANKEQPEFEVVFSAIGMTQAEVIKSSLEASGIPVFLESESQMLPFAGSGLGEARILVPVERAAEARELLSAGTGE